MRKPLMKKSIILIIFWATIMLPVNVYAGGLGPNNFEECLDKYVNEAEKEYVNEAEKEYAARMLAETCRMEYKDKRTDQIYMQFYDCVRDNLEDAKTRLSAQLSIKRCRVKHFY